MKTIKIEGLYDAAYRAYSNISFDPEKRAERIVKDYEEELNQDLESMPESERRRYIDGYKKHLFAWLRAKSNCISSMITGPANFPVRRAEKANQSEHNRCEEFIEWRKKALRAIERNSEEAKPQEQKDAERWNQIKSRLESSMSTIVAIDNGTNRYSSKPLFVSSIAGTVKTLAKHGDAVMVERCLDLIREWNKQTKKPIISEKHSIWNLAVVCFEQKKSDEERRTAESTESEINGVRVVKNQQADRLQLFFDGKPEQEMISKLKHAAFRWSPSNGCWQRQLTQNAIYSANSILK